MAARTAAGASGWPLRRQPVSARQQGPRLHRRPLDFGVACAFVDEHHRHHSAPRGHKFSLGVLTDDGTLGRRGDCRPPCRPAFR
jgi:hypothetical protein